MNLQFHFMVNIVAGWVNRHQQDVIDYLSEGREILIEQLGGKPKPFSNSQRIRLARKAKKLGRRALFGIEILVGQEAPAETERQSRFLVDTYRATHWNTSIGIGKLGSVLPCTGAHAAIRQKRRCSLSAVEVNLRETAGQNLNPSVPVGSPSVQV